MSRLSIVENKLTGFETFIEDTEKTFGIQKDRMYKMQLQIDRIKENMQTHGGSLNKLITEMS